MSALHALESALLPGPVHVLGTTPSTNDHAKALARDGAPHGTLVVADQQTAGRGRLGRVWQSPSGVNVALSMVLRPGLPLQHAHLVSFAAAVALAEAAGGRTGLKWPNDLLAVDGRKVGGILAERDPDGAFLVVGIGVNVGWAPSELPATTLAEVGGVIDRIALIADTARRLDGYFAWLPERRAELLDCWRAHSLMTGRSVSVGAVQGTAVDIDVDGALLVRTGSGIERILAGDVSLLG